MLKVHLAHCCYVFDPRFLSFLSIDHLSQHTARLGHGFASVGLAEQREEPGLALRGGCSRTDRLQPVIPRFFDKEERTRIRSLCSHFQGGESGINC